MRDRSRLRRRSGRIPAAAAAAVLVLGGGAVGAGYEIMRARQAQQVAEARAAQAGTEAQAAEQRAQQEVERVLAIAADPAARRATGRLSGGGTATVVVSGTQAALVTTGAPALATGRAYQLWIVRPGSVVSAGLGPSGATAAGRWSRTVAGVRAGDRVAISVEPAGGSLQPTTTPLTAIAI